MTGEKYLLGYLYALLLFVLSLALYFRNTPICTWAIVFVMAMVTFEAVYILGVKQYDDICDMCQQMWCYNKHHRTPKNT